MKDVHTHVFDRIRFARRAAGLSRKALARSLGVSVSAVALWEHPRGTIPRPVHLIQIATLLGVAADWLLVGRGDFRPDASAPAIVLTTFACDGDEELLLAAWRRANPGHRQHVLALLAAILPRSAKSAMQ